MNVALIGALLAASLQAGEINRLMMTLHQRGQYSGSIVVAQRGKIVYRNAFGEANERTHQPFTPGTPSCLASVSKQFTAMAVMMLAEQKKLDYDDPVAKYLPEVSRYGAGITIRHLLTHTSGIPDVGDLGIDHPGLTNAEVLKTLSALTSTPPTKPGETYRYSNTGYILLGLVVERVSGQTLGDFLQQRVFRPLGMRNTSVGRRPPGAAVGYDAFGKLDDSCGDTTGDGGIWSTVDDLLKWDQALYGNKLVRAATLEQAFTPGSVREGTTTYGFGWNIAGDRVWHTGSTYGFRAFIERRRSERTTVIMLTNHGNSRRPDINAAIVNILAGKPYAFPKRSIAEAMYAAIAKEGLQAGIAAHDRLCSTSDYDCGEGELNSLGYELLAGDRKPDEAIEIFRMNTAAFPASSNAFDSLAEAYQVSGNKELAIRNYRRALELDPANMHSQAALKALLP